tara:strand:+ start:13877 stop:14461 length:585 start_codon:yes stop_codon:yes gene_type:complete
MKRCVEYAFIHDNRAEFSVRTMCLILKLHPSGFYAWRDKPLSKSIGKTNALFVATLPYPPGVRQCRKAAEAAAVSELPEGGRLPDAEIKSDSSGELTTVENKGRDPFEIIPFYTMFFATNHLPHTRDLSPALQRRARILRFNRTFSSVEQDPHLIEKLKGELPGILNHALEALKNLFTDGAFVEPHSSKDAKKD